MTTNHTNNRKRSSSFISLEDYSDDVNDRPTKRIRVLDFTTGLKSSLWRIGATFSSMALWLLQPRQKFDETFTWQARNAGDEMQDKAQQNMGRGRPMGYDQDMGRGRPMGYDQDMGRGRPMGYDQGVRQDNHALSNFRFRPDPLLGVENRNPNTSHRSAAVASSNKSTSNLPSQRFPSAASQNSRRSVLERFSDDRAGRRSPSRLFPDPPLSRRGYYQQPYVGTVNKIKQLKERDDYAELIKQCASRHLPGNPYNRTVEPVIRQQPAPVKTARKIDPDDSDVIEITSFIDTNVQRSTNEQTTRLSLRPKWRQKPHPAGKQHSAPDGADAYRRSNCRHEDDRSSSSDAGHDDMRNGVQTTSGHMNGAYNQSGDSKSTALTRRQFTNDAATLGFTSFVQRLRHGLQSKKTVLDIEPELCAASRIPEQTKIKSPVTSTNDDVIVLDDVVSISSSRAESPDIVVLSGDLDVSAVRAALESCTVASPRWIKEMKDGQEAEAAALLRAAVEAQMEIKFLSEERDKNYNAFEEKIRRRLRIAELVPAVIEEPEPEPDDESVSYPGLTSSMERVVTAALVPYPPNEILVEHRNIQIRRSDVATLSGTTWLNDEVINYHMNLMMQRGEEEGRPKVHAFNTFFYQKLIQQGHDSLKRWTRRVDVFSMDYLVVPVHLQMHWCMAIVDFRKKEIRYYDSMGGSNNTCLNALKQYLQDESLDKKKRAFDTSCFKLINAKGPQQLNGSDCGVFSTICAEHVTRDVPLTYSQDLMPYFRRRMVYEIMSKKLLQ